MDDRPVVAGRTINPVANIIYLIFAVIEVILLLRFFFLLLGANSANGFVAFIYNVSSPLVAPFYGIFGQLRKAGEQFVAVFDPSTLIALIVYGLIGWILVRLLTPRAVV
jgi:hypothetical protein